MLITYVPDESNRAARTLAANFPILLFCDQTLMKASLTEAAFLKDLALAKASWVEAATDAIANPASTEDWSEELGGWSILSERLSQPQERAAFRAVVDELLSGVLHSALVTLDGGSQLAETTALTLHDDQGNSFKRFLHEFWPEYSDGSEA